jgi:hypothetical protein
VNISGFLAIVVISVLLGTAGQQVYGQYGGGPPQSNANNYNVSINSDKESYAIGETIILSGTVSKYEENRSLQIAIFDSTNKLLLTTEITVTANGIFSYEISNNEKFSKAGEYTLRAQYGKTHVNVEKILFTLVDVDKSAEPSTKPANAVESIHSPSKIPDWIKNNAGWWADGSIDDNSFVQGIQFLIKEGLMSIPPTQDTSSVSNDIPAWVKNNAGWWADGSIDDNSFVQGIQFLISNGMIKVN